MIKECQEVLKCKSCKEIFLYDKTSRKVFYEGKSKQIFTKIIRCPYCGYSGLVEHGLDHIACKK